MGDIPHYVKIWPKLTNPLKNADFQTTFARSVSAATPSEKSSINTNRKSTAVRCLGEGGGKNGVSKI